MTFTSLRARKLHNALQHCLSRSYHLLTNAATEEQLVHSRLQKAESGILDIKIKSVPNGEVNRIEED